MNQGDRVNADVKELANLFLMPFEEAVKINLPVARRLRALSSVIGGLPPHKDLQRIHLIQEAMLCEPVVNKVQCNEMIIYFAQLNKMHELVVDGCTFLLTEISRIQKSSDLLYAPQNNLMLDEPLCFYHRGIAKYFLKQDAGAKKDLLQFFNNYIFTKRNHSHKDFHIYFEVILKLSDLCIRNNEFSEAIHYFPGVIEMFQSYNKKGENWGTLQQMYFTFCDVYCKNGQFRKGIWQIKKIMPKEEDMKNQKGRKECMEKIHDVKKEWKVWKGKQAKTMEQQQKLEGKEDEKEVDGKNPVPIATPASAETATKHIATTTITSKGLFEAPNSKEIEEIDYKHQPQKTIRSPERLPQPEKKSKPKEDTGCVICMDKAAMMAFIPCGHLCCCSGCAVSVKECPICRCEKQGQLRVFVS